MAVVGSQGCPENLMIPMIPASPRETQVLGLPRALWGTCCSFLEYPSLDISGDPSLTSFRTRPSKACPVYPRLLPPLCSLLSLPNLYHLTYHLIDCYLVNCLPSCSRFQAPCSQDSAVTHFAPGLRKELAQIGTLISVE